MTWSLTVSHSDSVRWMKLALRRRRPALLSLHSWGRAACWSHDCGTVFPGVGCAISPAIWVNRSGLLPCHEASPPDPALLTLGRGYCHTETDGTYGGRLMSAPGWHDRRAATLRVWKFEEICCVSWCQRWCRDIRSFTACYVDYSPSLIFSAVAILMRSSLKKDFKFNWDLPVW